MYRLTREEIPHDVEKIIMPRVPVKKRLSAARGHINLSPRNKALALYCLLFDDDLRVGKEAINSFLNLSDMEVMSMLKLSLPPAVLECLLMRLMDKKNLYGFLEKLQKFHKMENMLGRIGNSVDILCNILDCTYNRSKYEKEGIPNKEKRSERATVKLAQDAVFLGLEIKEIESMVRQLNAKVEKNILSNLFETKEDGKKVKKKRRSSSADVRSNSARKRNNKSRKHDNTKNQNLDTDEPPPINEDFFNFLARAETKVIRAMSSDLDVALGALNKRSPSSMVRIVDIRELLPHGPGRHDIQQDALKKNEKLILSICAFVIVISIMVIIIYSEMTC